MSGLDRDGGQGSVVGIVTGGQGGVVSIVTGGQGSVVGIVTGGQGSVVGIVTGGQGGIMGTVTRCGLDGPRIECGWGQDSPCHPDRPQGPSSLPYDRYRVFPGGRVATACC
jgi:hypothetical protein